MTAFDQTIFVNGVAQVIIAATLALSLMGAATVLRRPAMWSFAFVFAIIASAQSAMAVLVWLPTTGALADMWRTGLDLLVAVLIGMAYAAIRHAVRTVVDPASPGFPAVRTLCWWALASVAANALFGLILATFWPALAQPRIFVALRALVSLATGAGAYHAWTSARTANADPRALRWLALGFALFALRAPINAAAAFIALSGPVPGLSLLLLGNVITLALLGAASLLATLGQERVAYAALTEALVRAQETIASAARAKESAVLERFFTLSLDMMCIAGVDGYFRRVSPAFDALGYSPQELLSRPFLDFVHPDDIPATMAEVEKLARGVPTIYFENRYRCRDGSYRLLAWTSAPDSSGTLYAIARDITDAKDAVNELARAKDAADLANRELESFSYSVAHDLRAPLRSIDGFSLALLEDNAHQLDSEGRKFLALVRESAQHMGRLIDDLLRLSRITRSELHNETVDLSALAGAAIERLQRQEPARSVNIVIEHGLRTQGDMQLLAVVMENLLSNAWKFTGKRADARVEFGASVHDGTLAYFVRDNGAGFDMAFVSKLFRMFQRLHHAADYEGTGVGLVTVRRIIERHGGRVWAEARVDQGATIFFTLNGAGGMPAGGRASSRPQA